MKSEQENFSLLKKYRENNSLVSIETIKNFEYGTFSEFKEQLKTTINDSYDSFIFEMEHVIALAECLNKDYETMAEEIESQNFYHPEFAGKQDRIKTAYETKDYSTIRKMYSYLDTLFNKEKYLLNITIMADEWFHHAVKLNIDIKEERQHLEILKTKLEDFDRFKESFNYLDEVKEKLNALGEIIEFGKTKAFTKRFNDLKAFVSDENIAKNLFGNSTTNLKFHESHSYINDEFKLNEINDYVENKIIKSTFNKIKQKFPNYLNTLAEDYISNLTDNNITNFLNTKNFESKIIVDFEMSKSQKYVRVLSFSDNSILGITNKNTPVIFDNNTLQKELNQISSDYIGFVLRKKPQTAALFKEALINSEYDINGALITIRSFLEHEDILKNINFQLSEVSDRSFEVIDDLINRNVEEFRLKQFAHSITSSKYKYLYNEETYEIFKDIKETGLLKSDIQNMIGKKIAAHKSPEDFNNSLRLFLNSINEFDAESYTLKEKGVNINNSINFDNIKVLHIENYEQSKALGSSSWCIVRDQHYFNQYTEDDSRQFFIYNFNKSSDDVESMIGMTLTDSGSFYVAHYKDDDSYRKDNFLKDIQFQIIHKYPELFLSLDKDLELEVTQYFEKMEEEKIKNTIKTKIPRSI